MSKQTRKTIMITSMIVILMFGFSFALVPLYRVFCQVTGLNTRIRVSDIENTQEINLPVINRVILMQFVATNHADLPWEFYPKKNSLTVHPNQTAKMIFYAKNNASHTITVQAIPSFAPAVAGKYFHKIECFCFRRQTLAAGETKEMPVIFRVGNDLPRTIQTITLAYTLFDVTPKGLDDETHGKKISLH